MDGHLSLAGTLRLVCTNTVTWEDRSPQPVPRQEEAWASFKAPVPIWKLGSPQGLTLHSRLVLQAAALSPATPAQRCSPALGLAAPSTGTHLTAGHHLPLSLLHGRTPRHWRWSTVSHTLHFTQTLLSSQQSQVQHDKSQSCILGFFKHYFLFVFVRTPLFFQPLSLLAGTESLCPWNVFLTGRFTGTDPSVTLQSLLIEPPHPLPHCGVCVLVVSEHHALRLVKFFFFPEASSANHWMQRDTGKSSFWNHTPCV